ncbi:MAG: S-layer homology domain-containing protein [Clostridia bacterium]|nr:S-layer homology domain-containing protein [Clostridia bacterium]
MKKILTFLLALLMLASVCVIGASAESFCPLDGWKKSGQGTITVKKANPSFVVKDGKIGEGEYELLDIDRTDTDSPLHVLYKNTDNMNDGLEMLGTIEFYFSWDEVHGFNFAIKNKPARISQLKSPNAEGDPEDHFATDNAYVINLLTENGYTGTRKDGYVEGTMDAPNYCVYYVLAKRTDNGEYIEGHYDANQLGLNGDYDPVAGTDYVINYTDDGWSIVEWSVPFSYFESGEVGEGTSVFACLTATAAGDAEDRYETDDDGKYVNMYEDTFGVGLGDKCFMVDAKVDKSGGFPEFILSDELIPTPAPVSFVDVKATDYFYDAVNWAVENKVTNGMDKTHFAPAAGCTRGQVVTFLWRSAGEPDPKNTNNPFDDIQEGDYFYKAVLWAVEKGITNGMDKTHFAPGAICTRGQIVTFLYRWKGSPEPKNSNNPFSDVKADDYFYKAVLWAVENKITNGMDAKHFAPGDTCTRGHVVTFMFRGK